MQPGEAAQTAIVALSKGVFYSAKRNKKVSLTWALGLLLTIFASGFRVSMEAAQTYENEMAMADMSEPIEQAVRKFRRFDDDYARSRGWFFGCDERCQRHKLKRDAALRELEQLQAEEQRAMSQVKAKVGVFSEYGVAETRERFWTSFSGGKSFAKRQSMWDLLFMSLSGSSRDENTMGILLKWLLQLLFNFTIGLVGALVVFVFQLWSLVFSYQSNPLSGLAFATAATIAAASMVATYLFAMYFCAASGVAAIGAAAHAQARIDAQRGGTPARGYYVQQQHYRPPTGGYGGAYQRPHYQ